MEKELYIKQCCIDKKLPVLLRENVGRMVTFYSQGEWGIDRLWNAVSHMVSNTMQSNDPMHPIEHTGGKIHMLLILPTLDKHVFDTVLRYKQHGWFDKLTIICCSVRLTLKQYIDYDSSLNATNPNAIVNIFAGKSAANYQSLWLRWDDKTLQTLFVSGPMFTTKVGNPPFAPYTATYLDKVKESEGEAYNASLLSQITDVWRDIIGQDL